MTKEIALKLLAVYGKAWETQDPNLIGTIFTDDATYNPPDSPINIGKPAIKTYWQRQIVEKEKDVRFRLLNVWIDGETVIAEWHTDFTLTRKNKRVSMDEVAILTTRDRLFSSLREYYKAEISPV